MMPLVVVQADLKEVMDRLASLEAQLEQSMAEKVGGAAARGPGGVCLNIF
jgi:tetrahydromethanopterin S-methyltransferase subunit G